MVYNKQDPFENKMRRQAREALRLKEQEFAVKYAAASKRELLGYVLACKKALGHTPHDCEIVGGQYIKKRFGGNWNTVLREAGLRLMGPPPKPENRKIFKQEVQRQKMLFREKSQKAQKPGEGEK